MAGRGPLGQALTASLGTADHEPVRALVQKCFGVELPGGIDHHLVVRADGRVAAYAAGRVVTLSDGSRAVLMGLVCVDPGQRGQGLGRRLLLSFVDAVHRGPGLGVVLNCGEPLVGFYRREGFVPVATSASYLREGRLVVDRDPVLWSGIPGAPTPSFGDPAFLGIDL